MSIESIGQNKEVKIQSLSNSAEKEEVIDFDPSKDFSQKEMEFLKERLEQDRNGDSRQKFGFYNLAVNLLTLFPEKTAYFGLLDLSFEDFEKLYSTELKENYHILAFMQKSLFPESSFREDVKAQLGNMLVFRVPQKPMDIATKAAYINLAAPEITAMRNLELIWIDLKDLIERNIREKNWTGLLIHVRDAKFLFPAEFARTFHFSEEFKKEILNFYCDNHGDFWATKIGDAILIEEFLAEKLEMTDKGFKVTMPKGKENFGEKESIPIERNY